LIYTRSGDPEEMTMRRMLVVLAVAAALGLGVSGTAMADAPADRVPIPPGNSAKSVWSDHGRTISEPECRAWGKEVVAAGLAKTYACQYQPDADYPYHPWLLRILD
jgi:hypothetical protein